ncbi:MAG: ABC-ATPase domain-containing protein [Armatimonadota bacterium]|nr:ABC-ATPase domain-containing protein [Armatimonadota bacterium]
MMKPARSRRSTERSPRWYVDLEAIPDAMLPSERLRDKLIVSNNKGVQLYRELAGAYRFDRFELYLDAVLPDPVAPSAYARIRVDQAEAQVPREFWARPAARVAAQDYLARSFRDALQKHVRTRWSNRVTPFALEAGGQEILVRTGCTVADDFVEIRVVVSLPAEGRKVMAKPAQAMFFEDLPAAVGAGLLWPNLDAEAGRRHVETYEDHLALAAALPEHGLVAFVGDGSILGRDSGPGDRPLRGSRAVATHAPDELAVTITLPHRGPVRGLGIRRGVTLIAGNLYSGKSTLLAALTRGVYPHVPGDGRELVATVPDAVAIRADVGRRVERVDVSAFVHALPHSHDVTALSIERATGTLSMAAAVSEALELGTSLLLFDEDDSAIAFVARDAVMQRLIPGQREAFTPLVERVRPLWEQHGISTVISTGGLGEYLEVADTVIVVENFQLIAATDCARRLVAEQALRRTADARPLALPAVRCPLPRGIGGVKGRGLRADMRGRDALAIGRDTVDVSPLAQLVDPAQARAAGDAVLYAVEKDFIDGNASVAEVLDRVFTDIETSGLAVLATRKPDAAEYAMPRRHEVGAILNRLRSLQVRTRRAAGETPGAAAPPVAADAGSSVDGAVPENLPDQ